MLTSREQFEAAWHNEYPLHSSTAFTRSGFDPERYANTRVQDGWLMWQAAILQAATRDNKNVRPVAMDAAFDALTEWPSMTPRAVFYAGWEAATRDAPSADAERIRQLEHALVYVAHSMHSERQYMLAEGITLGDVSFVRVKIADIDVSVEIPESVARAMYDAAMQKTARKADERRIAIAASAPKEST